MLAIEDFSCNNSLARVEFSDTVSYFIVVCSRQSRNFTCCRIIRLFFNRRESDNAMHPLKTGSNKYEANHKKSDTFMNN